MNTKRLKAVALILAGLGIVTILFRNGVIEFPFISTGISIWLVLFVIGLVLGLSGFKEHENLTIFGILFYGFIGYWGSLLSGWWIGRNIKAKTLRTNLNRAATWAMPRIQRGVSTLRRIRIPNIRRHP